MIRYLNTTEVAARIGVTRATVSKYTLPEPDAMIGPMRGWLPETIDAWHAGRPGSGRWSGSDRGRPNRSHTVSETDPA